MADSFIEEEGVHHEQDGTSSVPISAIAGAAAAAGVAAIAALAVILRRRKNEEHQFIDMDKDSVATSVTPPPEARMAHNEDIEIDLDHTFFDENLFQENYREQELAYNDLYPQDDLSTINEDLGFNGDDVSI